MEIFCPHKRSFVNKNFQGKFQLITSLRTPYIKIQFFSDFSTFFSPVVPKLESINQLLIFIDFLVFDEPTFFPPKHAFHNCSFELSKVSESSKTKTHSDSTKCLKVIPKKFRNPIKQKKEKKIANF